MFLKVFFAVIVKLHFVSSFSSFHQTCFLCRYDQYKKLRAAIDKNEGGLEEFSRGYEKFGFIRRCVVDIVILFSLYVDCYPKTIME